MTYENRYGVNYAYGVLTQAADKAAATLVSDDFINRLPTGLSTTTYVPVTLQDAATGTYEIVWVNNHAAGSNTANVLRGRESTTALTWPAGTLWIVAPTQRDGVLWVPTRSALPTDAHVGLRAIIADEQVVVEWVLGVGWAGTGPVAYRTNQLLAADAPSVTFVNIPPTLKRLQLDWMARGTGAATYSDLRIRVNNNATGAYYTNIHHQVGTVINCYCDTQITFGAIGALASASAASNIWSAGEAVIVGWNMTAPAQATPHIQFHAGMWLSAAESFYSQGNIMFYANGPYTSLTLYAGGGNLKAGSEFTLYGWG